MYLVLIATNIETGWGFEECFLCKTLLEAKQVQAVCGGHIFQRTMRCIDES